MSGTEFPGPGDEWQARIQALKAGDRRALIEDAAKRQGMAARIAQRRLRESRALEVFKGRLPRGWVR
jgi:hypothetical protein